MQLLHWRCLFVSSPAHALFKTACHVYARTAFRGVPASRTPVYTFIRLGGRLRGGKRRQQAAERLRAAGDWRRRHRDAGAAGAATSCLPAFRPAARPRPTPTRGGRTGGTCQVRRCGSGASTVLVSPPRWRRPAAWRTSTVTALLSSCRWLRCDFRCLLRMLHAATSPPFGVSSTMLRWDGFATTHLLQLPLPAGLPAC